MSKEQNMRTVSFRLSEESFKRLKKHRKYTRWVQLLVTQFLNICPTCGQAFKNQLELSKSTHAANPFAPENSKSTK